MTFLGALYIGLKQNEINDRLRTLQDYVALVTIPGPEGTIKLINVGKANLYLWGFDMPNNIQRRFEKPRLISTNTGDAAYYWIPAPDLGKIENTTTFDFRFYLTDEYDNKWISENGGDATPIKITQPDGSQKDALQIKVWSYRTSKENWQF